MDGEGTPNPDGKLDEVEPELVGRVMLPEGTPEKSPIGIAVRMLTEPKFAFDRTNKASTPNYIPSDRRHLQHVPDILKAGLAKKRRGRELGFAKFFTVVKKVSDDGTPILRTILDCRAANEAFEDPPPVNLCPLQELQEVFRNVPAMRTLDLRHWYHQIAVGEHLQRWFTVAFGSLRLQWSTLPMGWKWACFIAQSVTMFAVAGKDALEWTALPRVYASGNVRVAVVYDNVLAGGPPEELEEFWMGLHRRLAELKAIVKEDFAASAHKTIETLGIAWAPSEKGLRWAVLDKLKDKASLAAQQLTTRNVLPSKVVAGALGLVAWSLYASRAPMLVLQPLYRALAHVVSLAGWRSYTPTAAFAPLVGLLHDVCRMGWVAFPRTRTEAIIFTDAHITGYGAVGDHPTRAIAGRWSSTYESRDMFVLEAAAALQAVLAFGSKNARLFLVTDNKALFFCLLRKTTACPRAAPILQRLFDIVKEREVAISPGWVRSEHNPADPLSRGLPWRQAQLDAAVDLTEWSSPPAQEVGYLLGRVVG